MAKRNRPTAEHVASRTQDRGWFLEQLVTIETAIWGRWDYLLGLLQEGTIGTPQDRPIPQLPWRSSMAPGRPEWPNEERWDGHDIRDALGTTGEARSHALSVFERCHCRGDGLVELVEWWLWGFGSRSIAERPRISAESEIDQYHLLELHRLIAHPCDWGAALAGEYYGPRGKARSAWFPTPMEVCTTMVAMQFADAQREGIDTRAQTVMDPCVGTGPMLLAASNYSLRLYGQDIDRAMCRLCEWNGWLHVPWLVRPLPDAMFATSSQADQENHHEAQQAVQEAHQQASQWIEAAAAEQQPASATRVPAARQLALFE